jgi:hypothetical protein
MGPLDTLRTMRQASRRRRVRGRRSGQITDGTVKLQTEWSNYRRNGRITDGMVELQTEWSIYRRNGQITDGMVELQTEWSNYRRNGIFNAAEHPASCGRTRQAEGAETVVQLEAMLAAYVDIFLNDRAAG